MLDVVGYLAVACVLVVRGHRWVVNRQRRQRVFTHIQIRNPGMLGYGGGVRRS